MSLSIFFIFIGKAIADIVETTTLWNKSIFSLYFKIDSFFGAKDKTDHRKDHPNKLLKTLFHTILVPFTDIWHLANSLRRLGIYSAIFCSAYIGSLGELLTILEYVKFMGWTIFYNITGFHVVYEYILKIKRERY